MPALGTTVVEGKEVVEDGLASVVDGGVADEVVEDEPASVVEGAGDSVVPGDTGGTDVADGD